MSAKGMINEAEATERNQKEQLKQSKAMMNEAKQSELKESIKGAKGKIRPHFSV